MRKRTDSVSSQRWAWPGAWRKETRGGVGSDSCEEPVCSTQTRSQVHICGGLQLGVWLGGCQHQLNPGHLFPSERLAPAQHMEWKLWQWPCQKRITKKWETSIKSKAITELSTGYCLGQWFLSVNLKMLFTLNLDFRLHITFFNIYCFILLKNYSFLEVHVQLLGIVKFLGLPFTKWIWIQFILIR